MIIGIDGVPPSLLFYWAKINKLPNFANIIKRGHFGILESTIPPQTAVANTSFATGNNPGKHGIFDFIKREEGTYNFRLINASNKCGKSFWKIASDYGKKVAILFLPFTYPPEKVNGVIIPGLGAPEGGNAIYPSYIFDELMEKIPGFSSIIQTYGELPMWKEREYYIKKIPENMKVKIEILKYLEKKYDFDLILLYFREPDIIHHLAWDAFDQRLPNYNKRESKKYRNLVFFCYKEMDKKIGELIERYEKKYNFIFFSDHGHGVRYKYTRFGTMNDFLIEKGFLKLKIQKKSLMYKLGINKAKIYNIIHKIGLYNILSKIIPKKVVEKIPEKKDLEDVDWSRTLAYSFGESSYIYINLEGREPIGAVKSDEYYSICNKIINTLKEVKDPKTGKCVFEKIFMRDEIFHGSMIKYAPDIIIIPREIPTELDETKVISNFDGTPELITEDHQINGIYIFYGQQFTKIYIKKAKIFDLAPTILSLLRITPPNNMDGKILIKIPRILENQLKQQPMSEKTRIKKSVRKLKSKKVV